MANNSTVKKRNKRMERLALIKERYKKLILDPRKEIETEIERDLKEDGAFNVSDDGDFCQNDSD